VAGALLGAISPASFGHIGLDFVRDVAHHFEAETILDVSARIATCTV